MKNQTAASAGDHRVVEDFEAFFERLHPRLYRMAYLLTGNRADAADIAQETMARVLERWDRVRRMDSPDGYACRIAMHLNHRRVRGLRLASRSLSWPPDREPAVEERSDVMRTLLALPKGQREALVLVEWYGLSAAQAGKALGIAPGSVRSRLSRGREAFRHLIGEGYG